MRGQQIDDGPPVRARAPGPMNQKERLSCSAPVPLNADGLRGRYGILLTGWSWKSIRLANGACAVKWKGLVQPGAAGPYFAGLASHSPLISRTP